MTVAFAKNIRVGLSPLHHLLCRTGKTVGVAVGSICGRLEIHIGVPWAPARRPDLRVRNLDLGGRVIAGMLAAPRRTADPGREQTAGNGGLSSR